MRARRAAARLAGRSPVGRAAHGGNLNGVWNLNGHVLGLRARDARVDERTVTTHDLKVWPEFYADLRSGRKLFELRRADRDFKVHDWLRLREWKPDDIATATPGGYTGESVLRRICYVLQAKDVRELVPPDRFIDGSFAPPPVPLADGWCILGLEPELTFLEVSLAGRPLYLGSIDKAQVREAKRYMQALQILVEREKERASAIKTEPPRSGT